MIAEEVIRALREICQNSSCGTQCPFSECDICFCDITEENEKKIAEIVEEWMYEN